MPWEELAVYWHSEAASDSSERLCCSLQLPLLERDTERERERESVCVCVCVCEQFCYQLIRGIVIKGQLMTYIYTWIWTKHCALYSWGTSLHDLAKWTTFKIHPHDTETHAHSKDVCTLLIKEFRQRLCNTQNVLKVKSYNAQFISTHCHIYHKHHTNNTCFHIRGTKLASQHCPVLNSWITRRVS